jgi:hypothetical protein
MKFVLTGVVLLLLSATDAIADPIAIQKGFAGAVDQGGFTGPAWELVGDEFHLTGLFTGVVLGLPCPCDPGTSLSMSHASQMSGFGDVTLGSKEFRDISIQATFHVQSPTTITLPDTIDPRAGFAFTFAFGLTGNVIGRNSLNDVLFSQPIVGNGTAGVGNFFPIVPAGAQYKPIAFYYNFEPFSGRVTPEPGSLVLIATSTVTLLRRRKNMRWVQ